MKRILAVLSTILCLSLVTQAGAWEQRVFKKKGMRPNDRATSITALTSSGITVYDKDGNAIGWFKDNGDIVLTTTTGQLLLPSSNDAVTPTLAFGDGDTGFYEESDDNITLSTAGVRQFTFTTGLFRSVSGSGGALVNVSTTATVPSFTPILTDSNTGIGSAAADQLSLIAGGKEMARLDGTASSGASMWALGGIAVGATSGLGLTGNTSFITFASGATPTAAGGAGIFSTNGDLFAINTTGTVTQLTSHDPITGEFYRNEFNIYTGLGKKTYASGTVVNYTVDKLNPEEEYKKVWIAEYQNNADIEVDLNAALTDEDVFFDGEIVSGETEYTIDPAVPAINGIWKLKKEKVTLFKLGTKKALKADHRLDVKTGKIYRKPSLEEAQAAAVTEFKFDWNRMPKFIRDAWGH